MTARPALRREEHQTPEPGFPPADQLPVDDDWPMDTPLHRHQMNLLIDSLTSHWRGRHDYYVGGDMFVYFSKEQALGVKQEVEAGLSPPESKHSRGPDFFVVRDVSDQDRDSWVAWEEGGRLPDIVVEFLSDCTRSRDLGQKKEEYEGILRVREYLVWDPRDPEAFQGWRLGPGGYMAIEEDSRGYRWSDVLGLWLGPREGVYLGIHHLWLRFHDRMGNLVFTHAEKEEQRANEEQRRANEEQRRADEEQRLREAEQRRADEERRLRVEAEDEIARLRALLRERGEE